MLRTLVAVLLLANLAFWAWSAGALEGIGLAPARERDPARLGLQVRPDAVRVLSPGAAAAALSAASVPTRAARTTLVCLEAGPFAPAAIEAAERALATVALSDSSWVRTNHDIAAQYAVVLGPFANRDALQKKREELGRLRVPFEALDLPGDGGAGAPAQPGFALGRYDNRDGAQSALASFNERGVRTARVAELRPAGSEIRLRIESATPAQVEQLRALSAAALGGGFAPCASR